ncbi:PIN domain-containing protein [Amycolatopsis sp. NPDC004079]|uniref:PIN-like domain-containing protein n=1 Tax=Amycolatopsis sp. NPDC004079 TaxID=3154549 RepID=UPI0033B132EB
MWVERAFDMFGLLGKDVKPCVTIDVSRVGQRVNSENEQKKELMDLEDEFGGYLTPTDGDYQSVMLSGMVVLDANVLLNLYRYATSTREDLFNVLGKLGDRLWIPHQVALEFWKNREGALEDLKKVTKETVDALEGVSSQAPEIVSAWANRISLDNPNGEELSNLIQSGFKSAIKAIKELGDPEGVSGHWDTNKDNILASLRRIFSGKVGKRLEVEDEVKAREEARRRIAEKIPPGYKDSGKDDPCGDYIYWVQTLREARRRKVGVLLVTDDSRSDDWYRRQAGKTRGPRFELVDEMADFAGVRLFMMRTQSLLFHARRVLEVDVRTSSVEEAARVDERHFELNQQKHLVDSRELKRGKDRGIDIDQMRKIVRGSLAEDARNEQFRVQARLVRERYREHIERLGFEVFKRWEADGPWDLLAEREILRIAYYTLSQDYLNNLRLTQTRIVRIVEELADKKPGASVKVALILTGEPDPIILEFIDEFDLPAVWLDGLEWVGNPRAVSLGLV